MASQQLPPVPAPVAIMDQFIAPQTETLVLKEKVLSLSGDSFDVKLASGQPIFQIKAKHMSVSGRKSVFDMAGNHLFDLVKEHLHIHSTFAAQAPDGRKLLEVKSSLSCEWPFPCRFHRLSLLSFARSRFTVWLTTASSDWLQSHRNVYVPQDRQHCFLEDEGELAGLQSGHRG